MLNRVTFPSVFSAMGRNISAANDRLAQANQELSSGKRILRPSDDPIGALQIIQLRRDNALQAQYSSGAEDARQMLDANDSALQNATELMNSVIERITQAGGFAGQDATGREAIASDIEQVRAQLLSVANRTHVGRPLFSGTASPTPTFDSSGVYQGNSSPILRDIAESETLQVTIPGDQVFAAGGSNLFAALTDAANAIRSQDPAALQVASNQISSGIDSLNIAQTKIGAWQRRIDDAMAQNDVRQQANLLDISKLEDIDLEQAAINLKSSDVAYQATLQAAGKVMQYSLLDFLR